jgi:hypothetical protein
MHWSPFWEIPFSIFSPAGKINLFEKVFIIQVWTLSSDVPQNFTFPLCIFDIPSLFFSFLSGDFTFPRCQVARLWWA